MDSNVFNVYANALLEIAIESNNERLIRDEVKSLKEIIKKNNDFILIMHSKNLKNEDKYEIVDKIFSTCHPDLIAFLKVLIKNHLSFYIYEVLKETLFRFDDYLNIEEGTLYLSKELSDEEVEKIKTIAEEKTNKTIDLKVVIDKSLVGGFKLSLRNDIYDTSILTKINHIKKTLVKE